MPEVTDHPGQSRGEETMAEVTDGAEEQARADHQTADGGDDGPVHQLKPEPGETARSRGGGWRNLHRMLDVPLSLTVELGSTEMPLSEVLRLESGSVITIDRMPGEPIDLLINGRVFARGEVVVINDMFGYRITELVDDAEASVQTGGDGG